MPERASSEEERIVALLSERGINGLTELMLELSDISTDTFLTTIKWWDDLPSSKKGTGLLVSKLRDGGVIGYKRAHERTGVDGEMVVGPKQLEALWSVCLTPDGIDRETAREMCTKLAEKANTMPDELIDAVVGPEWKGTPAHPAKLVVLGAPREELQIRYEVWLHRLFNLDRADQPQASTRRKDGESDLGFSKRFWGWKDPDNLAERVAARREAKEALKMSAEMSAPVEVPKPLPMPKRELEATEASAPVAIQMSPEDNPVPAPVNADLDERYGVEAPWDDEDLEALPDEMKDEIELEEDPW